MITWLTHFLERGKFAELDLPAMTLGCAESLQGSKAMIRPQSIVWFERCFLGAIGIGLVNSALNWSKMQDAMAATPGADALPGGFLIGMMVVGIVINLVLWYFAARRRSNVAKWIIVVFFALGLIGLARTLVTGIAAPTMNILAYVAFALQAFGVYLLFQSDAKAWFAGRRDNNLTQTFS
jgi:hypothetical protein